MPKSKNGLRINFDKIKRFLPIIVIVASFLYNLYKSKFKKDKELFIKKDGTFIKEGFSFYEVRRGSIGGTKDSKRNEWIKVADINMKGTTPPPTSSSTSSLTKALTLEVYPKGIEKGITRQTFSILLKNKGTKSMKPLIYSKLDYGKTEGISFKDIKVLKYVENLDTRWEIWLQLGTDGVSNVPSTWHLENVMDDDTVLINTSTDITQNLANVEAYGVTKERQPVNDLEDRVNKLEKEHVKLGKKAEETRVMAKNTKEALGGVQEIIPQLTHYIQNIMTVLQRSGIGN